MCSRTPDARDETAGLLLSDMDCSSNPEMLFRWNKRIIILPTDKTSVITHHTTPLK